MKKNKTDGHALFYPYTLTNNKTIGCWHQEYLNNLI